MPNPDSSRIVHVRDPNAAISAIRRDGRRVVTFVGFSGRGYEDPVGVERLIERYLDDVDAASAIIGCGATEDGIGVVYRIAKRRGFATMGIVSAVAEKEGARFSADADTIYVIDDDTWGGRRDDGTLSPTSVAMVGASDEIIAIGGGDVGKDEVEAALAQGKPVRYREADMNHAAAIDGARKKGKPEPTDFKGPVHRIVGPAM